MKIIQLSSRWLGQTLAGGIQHPTPCSRRRSTLRHTLAAFVLSCLVVPSLALAQNSPPFANAGLTAVTPDGWVTWTNDPTNATFTVQTTTILPGETNWVDWVQVPVSNAVTVHRVFDPNPPSGMALIPAGSFLMGATTNRGHESYTNVYSQWE
jgi:hypothetical protein